MPCSKTPPVDLPSRLSAMEACCLQEREPPRQPGLLLYEANHTAHLLFFLSTHHRAVTRHVARLNTGLLARLWPGGTFTHWVTILNFTLIHHFTLLTDQPCLVASPVGRRPTSRPTLPGGKRGNFPNPHDPGGKTTDFSRPTLPAGRRPTSRPTLPGGKMSPAPGETLSSDE